MAIIIGCVLLGVAFLFVILAIRFSQLGYEYDDAVAWLVAGVIVSVIAATLLLWIPRYAITNQARDTERDYDRAVLLYCPPVRGAETTFEKEHWNMVMTYNMGKFNGAINLYHANKTGIWFHWQTTDVRDDIQPLSLATLCNA